MDLNGVEEIRYKQWVHVDRDNLETLVQEADIFVEELCEKLEKLLPHSFISKSQASFLTEKKLTLHENEYLVICDFSENVSFVVQDSVQGFHWNNSQATLYPIAIYYKSNGEVKTTNFIIISDCLVHNSVAVHLFNRHLHMFLKSKFGLSTQPFFFTFRMVLHYNS